MTGIRRILFLSACLLFVAISAGAQEYFYHTVTKAQGLYSISRTYGVTEDEIIKLNPGSEKVIKVGQTLRIPQKKSNDSSSFHTVQAGETLYELSRRNNVTIKEICDANPGLTVESLKAGMVISIPAPTGSSDEPSAVQDNSTGTVKQSASNSETAPDYKKIITIGRRVTIYRICKDYGISQEEFYRANPQYRSSRIRVGDKVRIPYSADELEIMSGESNDAIQEDIADITLPEGIHEEEDDDDMSVTAAFLLPFSLDDSVATERAKMLEFYRGVLLAVPAYW